MTCIPMWLGWMSVAFTAVGAFAAGAACAFMIMLRR